MIQVIGSTNLTFTFPAERSVAYEYYRNIPRLVSYLPHIQLVQTDGENHYRMLYNTIELNIYHIRIYCDVRVEFSLHEALLRIVPVERFPRVKPKSSLNSATTQGIYHSESRFYDEGTQTRIEYTLHLEADLPTPAGLRLVPNGVVGMITDNITKRRIKEIAGGFITNSITAFPAWQDLSLE